MHEGLITSTEKKSVENKSAIKHMWKTFYQFCHGPTARNTLLEEVI